MSCSCRWPDDFCSRCERQFVCGLASEACPEEGCDQKRMADNCHDEGYAAFVKQANPGRFHDPIGAPDG